MYAPLTSRYTFMNRWPKTLMYGTYQSFSWIMVFQRSLLSSRSYYSYTRTKLVASLLQQVDSKIALFAEHYKRNRTETHRRLLANWISDSNQIEQCGLDRQSTLIFLETGLTVSGKSLLSYIHTANHQEAIDYLYSCILQGRPFTNFFIKSLHGILLKNQTHTQAIMANGQMTAKAFHPGEFKTQMNSVLTKDGTIHDYVHPLNVQPEMDELVDYLNKNHPDVHAIEKAAFAHYNFVRIHPFDDGNGRLARLVMNYSLIRDQLHPCVISSDEESREKYYHTLNQADKKDIVPFIAFVAESYIQTLESVE